MSFLQNASNPQGFLGKLALFLMNLGHAPLTKWGLSHIALKRDAHVLDIGCGGGTTLKSLLSFCPEGKIYGLDYSSLSVERSRKLNQKAVEEGRCMVLEGNVLSMPFTNDSFDAITAVETIYFWQNLNLAFTEVNRVLKTGGQFLIINGMIGDGRKDKEWEEKVEGLKVYHAEELKQALHDAGFQEVQVYIEKRHYLALLAKK